MRFAELTGLCGKGVKISIRNMHIMSSWPNMADMALGNSQGLKKFVLEKTNAAKEAARICRTVETPVINSELKILSKESDIYNYCINGNYSLKAKYVRGPSKQLENEKTTIPLQVSNIEDVIINVSLILII